jgi:hypothetical protein
MPPFFGQPERGAPAYTRHGVINVFVALNVAIGQVIGERYARKSAPSSGVLRRVDKEVLVEFYIEVFVDNSSIHGAPR